MRPGLRSDCPEAVGLLPQRIKAEKIAAAKKTWHRLCFSILADSRERGINPKPKNPRRRQNDENAVDNTVVDTYNCAREQLPGQMAASARKL